MKSDQNPQLDRLRAFASANGLNWTSDLAQVFRVGQSTISRWMTAVRSQPVEDILPGPVLILLELFENGVETKELIEVRRLADIHESPDDIVDIPDEPEWTFKLPDRATSPVQIAVPSGCYMWVHGGFLNARIKRLTSAARHAPPKKANIYRDLVDRYSKVAQELSSPPRSAAAAAKAKENETVVE